MGQTSYLPFFLFGACVNAEAATDLTALGVLGLLNNFAAFEATDFDVCSFRGMTEALEWDRRDIRKTLSVFDFANTPLVNRSNQGSNLRMVQICVFQKPFDVPSFFVC